MTGSDESLPQETQPAENSGAETQGVEFAEISPGGTGTESPRGIEFLLDVPLEISVELGRKKMPIGDLLKLTHGSVVELDKLTNSPVDIFINHKLMGHGEVVVVNDRFAVRLIEIISPDDRVKSLA
ncbi:MAG: flagellar motor switch protein FliN [Deltaproteobacteria bacterium]|nr:flagellar motor switch protein FliN [Deltaproteobacteria bacterium]MBW1922744.1 flagellar motor switch protein FliN [Deltaproteobacteria bacterium]MBW1948186.1 flagellar motor switch protein FliN [Deltaproteobacteria bacterium]MBW2007427.1 flagellar motor switch protein FliN [Deltaproteobacteria bacterium]MBW2102804.1 flagellar motor switch protein FliN [Deltaproteobacteria bacterium]